MNNGGFDLTYGGSGVASYSGAINGAGGLNVNGGTLVLNGPPVNPPTGNGFTGTTTVNNGGTLLVSTSNTNINFGQVGNGNVVVNSGGLILMGSQNAFFGRNPRVQGATIATLTINAGGTVADNAGSNNPLPAMLIDGGTLSSSKPCVRDWGNFNLSGTVATMGDGMTSYITGGTIGLGTPGTSTVPRITVGNGDTLAISSTIAHCSQARDLGFIKDGPGLLLLTASNNFSGSVTITAGTLQLGTGAAARTAPS